MRKAFLWKSEFLLYIGMFSLRSLPSDGVVGDQWFLKLRIREIENIFFFVGNVIKLKMFFKEESTGHGNSVGDSHRNKTGGQKQREGKMRGWWNLRSKLWLLSEKSLEPLSLLAIVLPAAKLSKSRAEPKRSSTSPWLSRLPRLQNNQWASGILTDIWSDERDRKVKLGIEKNERW